MHSFQLILQFTMALGNSAFNYKDLKYCVVVLLEITTTATIDARFSCFILSSGE